MKLAILPLPFNLDVAQSILSQAGNCAHEFVFIDMQERIDRIPVSWWPQNAKAVACSPSDVDAVIRLVEAEACTQVISTAEAGLTIAAKVRKHFGFAGHSEDVELFSIDKSLMRHTLVDKGLSSVQSFRTTVAELAEELLSVDFPVVVKPVRLGGSICVQLLSSYPEVEGYLERIRSHPYGGDKTELTVESYIGGKEFSVEGQVFDGQVYYYGLTEKRTTDAPYFVETGHTFYTRHPHLETFSDYFQQVFEALGMRNCPFHVEFKVDGDKIEIIELHSRFGGDFITDLIHFSTGAEVFADQFNFLADKTVPAPIKAQDRLVSIEFVMAQEGELKAFTFPAQFESSVNVLKQKQDARIGDKIKSSTGFYDRIGWMIFESDSPQSRDEHLKLFTPVVTVG
ncbi:ATP-grasp domain-containing protein [Hahella sp. CR1]|uniref:ATP-grasp domain-containing protein n=1 Tax=Hahella sp. CR1 TaxID=2992807 RepID=UPI00244244D8|nr:ATP-grasp domain-containing protein [Hahella sp. CR1]MDG9671662.1 ATP-grasp domain-containing protein [Hahella sp. CR1]